MQAARLGSFVSGLGCSFLSGIRKTNFSFTASRGFRLIRTSVIVDSVCQALQIDMMPLITAVTRVSMGPLEESRTAILSFSHQSLFCTKLDLPIMQLVVNRERAERGISGSQFRSVGSPVIPVGPAVAPVFQAKCIAISVVNDACGSLMYALPGVEMLLICMVVRSFLGYHA